MRIRPAYLPFILLLVLSCNREQPTVNDALSIGGITEEGLVFEAMSRETIEFTVQANRDWTVTADPQFLSVSPSSGEAGVLSVVQVKSLSRNYGPEREGGIIIEAGSRRKEVKVIQRAFSPAWEPVDHPELITDGHPHLLASGKDFTAIREKAHESERLMVIYDYILRFADQTLQAKDLTYTLTGIRLLNVSIEALKRMFYLSFAYRMTGNPAYAERAIHEMETVCAFEDWHPAHFLDCAEMAMGVALAYDWCYPRLDAATREMVSTSLVEKGIKPFLNQYSGAENNWNQVCGGGIAYAALAVRDEAPEMMEAALSTILNPDIVNKYIGTPMDNYKPDGTYVEGPGYWCYGTSYNCLLLDAFKRHYGDYRGLLDKYPAFKRTQEYASAMITPSFHVFTYADQGFPAQLTIVPFFMYAMTGDSSHLFMADRMLSHGMLNEDHCRHERLLPASLVFACRPDGAYPAPRQPANLGYVGQGQSPVATFRAGWDSREAAFLGLKAGSPSTGHGHMDVGTFFYEADGIAWATDLGGENYNALESAGVDLWNTSQNSERWTVLRCALRGHNCLIFDGENQRVNGYASISDASFSSPENMYAMTDLSDLYSSQVQSVQRAVSLIDGSCAVVQDRITTKTASTNLCWNLVTDAVRAEITGNRVLLFAKNGKTCSLEFKGFPNPSIKMQPATPSLSCETPNTQNILTVNCTLNAGTRYDVCVTFSPGDATARTSNPYHFQ